MKDNHREHKMIDHARGTGRTTKQMTEAKHGALFIHSLPRLYAKELARRIGREDLQLLDTPSTPYIMEVLRGRIFSEIVVDHACNLSKTDWVFIKYNNNRDKP